MSNTILFIYPSWESRSVNGFIRNTDSEAISKIILLKNKSPHNKDSVENNIGKILDFSKTKNISCKEIVLSAEPTSIWSTLYQEVDFISKGDKVIMDVTTMSRNIIWTLLFFLKQKLSKISIVYHQPEKYDDTWISREPESPRLLFKHSGVMEVGKKTCLIIITSYDVDRTRQIIMKYEPSRVILLVQRGEQLENHIRNSPELHENISREMGVLDVKSILIDSFADDFGYSVLEEAVQSNLNYNIILASFGPKVSAISAYRLQSNYPQIALAYLPCKEYNVNYCKGIGNTISKEIEL